MRSWQSRSHLVHPGILLTLSPSAFDNYFLKAQKLRNRIRGDFDSVFRMQNVLRQSPDSQVVKSEGGVDVLVHPSAIRTAPTLAEVTSVASAADESSLDSYLQDILTVPASLAGIPALSVPAGYGDDRWPLGITIAGQWGSDKYVLHIGEIIASVLEGFDQRR
jgi:aspartyl-tRNA(Asn)/glutamyl-tRNA(Gln) amidotransferase subunit A